MVLVNKVISDRLVRTIKEFEGFEENAYLDVERRDGRGHVIARIWAIGYGRTGGVKEGDTTTREQEDAYLLAELERISEDLSKHIKVEVTQEMHDALVSFAYNVGLGAMKRSTLLRKLNESDILGAAEEFTRWIHAGGLTVPGLVNRREKEKKWFLEGV